MAQADRTFASEIKNRSKMKNTDYSLENLGMMISSESSLNALMDIIGEMGLEITGVQDA